MKKTEQRIKSVTAHGITLKVEKVLELNTFGEDIDLEFLDEKGNYHHYQSWHDKGEITYETHSTV